MALTLAIAVSAFQAARSVLSASQVRLRFRGREYVGVRSTVSSAEEVSGRGALQSAEGAVRLCVPELALPNPESGEQVEVNVAGAWKSYMIVRVTYDQARATLRLEYGARYG